MGGAGLCCWYTVTEAAPGEKEEAEDEAVAAFTTPLVMISLILLTAPKNDRSKSVWNKGKRAANQDRVKEIPPYCQQAVESVLGHADTEVCL